MITTSVVTSTFPKRLVASTPGMFAYTPNYTTFTGATTRTLHVITRDCYGVQFLFAGTMRKSATSGDPFEPVMNPYELIVTLQLCDINNVPYGPVHELTFDGRKWGLILADRLTDPLNIVFTKGQRFFLYTWGNTRKSDTTTINGETGQLTTDSPNFPRMESLGGQLSTNGVCGARFTSSPTIDVSFNSTTTGVFAVTNPGGTAPARIIGTVLADDFTAPAVAVIGDSISHASVDRLVRTEACSGLSWHQRAMNRNYANTVLAQDGMRAEWWSVANSYKVRTRIAALEYVDTLVLWLGTNDLANNQTVEQLVTNTINLTNLARLIGVRRVVGLTTLFRFQSTDWWQTYENQTESIAGVNAKIAEFNDWLLSDGLQYFNHVTDIVPAVQSKANGGKWLLSTTLLDTTAAAGATTTTIPVNTTLTANEFEGRHAFVNNQGVYITSNTSTAITLSSALSAGPAPGTPIKILRSQAADPTHPSAFGHKCIAEAFDCSVLTIT